MSQQDFAVTDYPYAKGDLLNKPNTYFYAEFKGRKFFRDWMDDRNKLLPEQFSLHPPPEIPDLLSISDLFQRLETGKPISTHTLLTTLYCLIADTSHEISPEIINILDRLLGKFEVNKRIHSGYMQNFRAVDKTAYHNLELYILAAEVFEQAYARLNDIRYLNVLLKVMDTLCAMNQMLDINLRERLARLVDRELDHVQKIAEKTGLKL